MFRGYDAPQLFREDTLLRIQHLYDEIAASQRSTHKINGIGR